MPVLCPLPWHGLSAQLPTGGCPAEELPCWSTPWQGNAQCPGLRSALAKGQDTSSIPQHHCLLPATDPRCPRPRAAAGAPLLSPSSAQAVPGLVSCPEQLWHSGITPSPVIPHLPVCRGNLIPALPSPTGPLTHWAPMAAPWSPRRAPLQSCSPEEPRPPPRPPWAGLGVSSPFYWMEMKF